MPLFRGEHCVSSCVHPCRRIRGRFALHSLHDAASLRPNGFGSVLTACDGASQNPRFAIASQEVRDNSYARRKRGGKPITFCIQVGQTSPKGGGEIEATPSPFLVQKNNDARWSTLLIGPDIGRFQHPQVLEPGKTLDFPFRLGESGQMRLRLTCWNGSQQSLACDVPPKGAKVATSEPFAVE